MSFFLQGYALVLLTRLLCKIVFRSLLKNLFRVMDLECFEIKKVNYDSSTRLYSPSFKLPPVFYKVRILQQWRNFHGIYQMRRVFYVISCISYVLHGQPCSEFFCHHCFVVFRFFSCKHLKSQIKQLALLIKKISVKISYMLVCKT